MDITLYSELVDIANEIRPETSLARLSEDKQKALATFFGSLSGVTKERNDIDIGAIIAWAFCVGHEWALRHWSLWSEDNKGGEPNGT